MSDPFPSQPLRLVRPVWLASLAFAPAFLLATPALADECATNADCGSGFSCDTVVTSAASSMGGVGGTAGTAGASFGGTGGSASGGAGAAAGTGSGFAAPAGGMSSGAAPGGSAGTGAVPAPVCGNLYCESWIESPSTCPQDCVFTTICAPAPCTDDSQCASGYSCPAAGSVGTGGGPNVTFCGDLLCSVSEDQRTCPVDCDPNYRRCTPGDRKCQSNLDCPTGFVCEFQGSGGLGGIGSGGASGGTAGTSEGGAPADPPALPGGTGGTAGGSGGYAGTAGMGLGGTGGSPDVGSCVPGGTGGSYGGGSYGGGSYGGTSGVGGDASGGTTSRGGTGTGAIGAVGGSSGSGGTGGNGGAVSGDRDERRVVTDRGCSLASGGETSSFGALVVALAALFRVSRRRRTRLT